MEQFDKCDFSEEVLISRVARYPELYDVRHPEFKSLSRRQKLWARMAASFKGDIDAGALSKRWRLLRDSYLRCRRELDSWTKGEPKKRKVWKHFYAMSFIEKVGFTSDSAKNEKSQVHEDPDACVRMIVDGRINELEHSIESSNLFIPPTQYKTEHEENFSEVHHTESMRSPTRQLSDSPIIIPENITTIPIESTMRGAKREESLDGNASILKSLTEHQDEDVLFVLCLVPYFKKLAMERKLELKSKFMQLLLEAIKTTPTTTVSCDHCKTCCKKCNEPVTTPSHCTDSVPYTSLINNP